MKVLKLNKSAIALIFTMMKNSIAKNNGDKEDEGDEGVKDLIDMTIRKMDHDHDGKISFSDVSTVLCIVMDIIIIITTVDKEPLLMEAFGNCLPSNRAGVEFIARVLDSRPTTMLYQA